jgi:hypothetical protein
MVKQEVESRHSFYQTKQLFGECQLVAVWNAARFWGLDKIIPVIGTPEYKRICKKANSIALGNGNYPGDGVTQQFELERLGLGVFPLRWDVGVIARSIPCELWVNCEIGYHSVLVVGYKKSVSGKVWLDELEVVYWFKDGRVDWVPWGEVLACGNLAAPPRYIAPIRVISNLVACS